MSSSNQSDTMHWMSLTAHYNPGKSEWSLRRADLSFQLPVGMSMGEFFVEQAHDFHWNRFQSDEWTIVTGFSSHTRWQNMLTINLEYDGVVEDGEYKTLRWRSWDYGILPPNTQKKNNWFPIDTLADHLRNRVSVMEQEAVFRILSADWT